MDAGEEVGSLSGKNIRTRLNGQEMQHATFDQFIFPVPRLLEYISQFTHLSPGDVIITGTPGGVGFKRNPMVVMKAGDTVEIEIDGVGLLKNPIVAEK